MVADTPAGPTHPGVALTAGSRVLLAAHLRAAEGSGVDERARRPERSDVSAIRRFAGAASDRHQVRGWLLPCDWRRHHQTRLLPQNAELAPAAAEKAARARRGGPR